MTGKAAVLKKIQKLYPDFDKDSPQVAELLDILKQKEYEGYQYEGADSSFELIVHRLVRKYKPFFDLISYKVLDELPYDNGHSATATIKLSVDGRVRIAASDGDGHVNALDREAHRLQGSRHGTERRHGGERPRSYNFVRRRGYLDDCRRVAGRYQCELDSARRLHRA